MSEWIAQGEDWTPQEPVSEAYDSSWPYNWKWGVSKDNQVHVWRSKGGIDGRPTHRGELSKLWGRDPKVTEGDTIGLATYTPPEVKLDGTVVAPPLIRIQTYYNQPTPPALWTWFQENFPKVPLMDATIVGSNGLRVANWEEKWPDLYNDKNDYSGKTIKWVWNDKDGLAMWETEGQDGEPLHLDGIREAWGRDRHGGDHMGYGDVYSDGTVMLGNYGRIPVKGLQDAKQEILKRYPDSKIDTSMSLTENEEPDFRDPSSIKTISASGMWAHDVLGENTSGRGHSGHRTAPNGTEVVVKGSGWTEQRSALNVGDEVTWATERGNPGMGFGGWKHTPSRGTITKLYTDIHGKPSAVVHWLSDGIDKESAHGLDELMPLTENPLRLGAWTRNEPEDQAGLGRENYVVEGMSTYSLDDYEVEFLLSRHLITPDIDYETEKVIPNAYVLSPRMWDEFGITNEGDSEAAWDYFDDVLGRNKGSNQQNRWNEPDPAFDPDSEVFDPVLMPPDFRQGRVIPALKKLFAKKPVWEKTAEADKEGAMIALYVPKETGKELRQSGGEPLEDMHITLIYFADKAEDRDDWDEIERIVEQFANQNPKMEGTINGYGVFYNDDADVLWAAPSINGLAKLRAELVEAVEDAGFTINGDYDWVPHITIKYDWSGRLPKIKKPIDITFDALSFTKGDKPSHMMFKGNFDKEGGWESKPVQDPSISMMDQNAVYEFLDAARKMWGMEDPNHPAFKTRALNALYILYPPDKCDELLNWYIQSFNTEHEENVDPHGWVTYSPR